MFSYLDRVKNINRRNFPVDTDPIWSADTTKTNITELLL